jgi:uncharacterized protein
VVEEPESEALTSYLDDAPLLATSRTAVVEVSRAVGLASPTAEAQTAVDELMNSCLLVEVTASLLRNARRLCSATVRTLDAIHLASAAQVEADELLAYDRRLIDGARALGLTPVSPTT